MSARMCGLAATLLGLALAACSANEVLPGDGTPLPAGSVPLLRPAPNFSAARHFTPPEEVATWQHHPEPVRAQQFSQDKAHCASLANKAPGAGAPDMKFYIVFVDCMRLAGYEETHS